MKETSGFTVLLEFHISCLSGSVFLQRSSECGSNESVSGLWYSGTIFPFGPEWDDDVLTFPRWQDKEFRFERERCGGRLCTCQQKYCKQRSVRFRPEPVFRQLELLWCGRLPWSGSRVSFGACFDCNKHLPPFLSSSSGAETASASSRPCDGSLTNPEASP